MYYVLLSAYVIWPEMDDDKSHFSCFFFASFHSRKVIHIVLA